jgi:hypothetical protein
MKRFLVVLGVASAIAVMAVSSALASAPVMPTLPVSAYGGTLLTALTNVLGQIWPYAAIFTGVGILVSAVKHWFGRKSAVAAAK